MMTEYLFMWGQKQSAMIAECMLLIFSRFNDECDITDGIDDVIRVHDQGFSHIYFSTESLETANKNAVRFLDKDKRRELFNIIQDKKSSCMHFLDELSSINPAELSDDGIPDLVRKYQDHIIWTNKIYRSSDSISTRAIEDEIKMGLRQYYTPRTLLKALSIISTPTTFDRLQKEQADWLNLLSLARQPSDDALLKHALRYPERYPNTWSYGEVFRHLRNRAIKENLTVLSERLKSLRKFHVGVYLSQEAIFSRFADCTRLRLLGMAVQELALSRFELRQAWSGAELLALPFLEHLSAKVGLDVASFMAAYNFSDLTDFLVNGKRLTKWEMRDRMDCSVIHLIDGELDYIYGRKARDYFEGKCIPSKSVDSVSGLAANPGKMQGRVRIVSVENLRQMEEDLASFTEGDVLVTTMTSPIIIPIAVKAAAIVTNQGGICSHAAVISRELDIPCIVGTHNATQVFKDGDIVELDADQGVVRKI
ncbi:MAG: PEP-utilizing enzyme [Candidatus Altiarchaeota archaeon]